MSSLDPAVLSTIVGPLLANHVWQSTLVAGAIALLALLLRRNRAHVRCWLWLAASLKFLVPFAALTAIGAQTGFQGTAPRLQPEIASVVDLVSETVSRPPVAIVPAATAGATGAERDGGRSRGRIVPSIAIGAWLLGAAFVLTRWWLAWRRIASAIHAGKRRPGADAEDARVFAIVRRVEARLACRRALPVVAVDTLLEPGVFGILRPVLLWPHGIASRLSDSQIEAIVAHELLHVRRRDNLVAAVQMVVQAIFWMHPLVWWIGTRLVDERERACDEAVLRLGGEPQLYAESILRTCEFSLESPLPCLAGVTGSNLKQRIERIMRQHTGESLSLVRKLLLATLGIAAMVVPLAVGAITAPRLQAQALASIKAGDPSFDVTSVKRNQSSEPRISMMNRPGGVWEGTNVTLGLLIRLAYQVQDFQVVGGPAWMYSDRFDVLGKRPESTGPGDPSAFFAMMRMLLADRFALKTHSETRELPIYALTLARRDGRLGPQLKASTVDCQAVLAGRATRAGGPPPPGGEASVGTARGAGPGFIPAPGERPQCGMTTGRGTFTGGGISLAQLAQRLSQDVGRIIVDKTGLTGGFDVDLKYAPTPGARSDLPAPPPGLNDRPADPDLPSLFTALEEQLGLKLESQRGPVDVLVIDSAQPPSDN